MYNCYKIHLNMYAISKLFRGIPAPGYPLGEALFRILPQTDEVLIYTSIFTLAASS